MSEITGRKVEIKFEDLHPEIRRIIDDTGETQLNSINTLKKVRGFTEIATGINLLVAPPVGIAMTAAIREGLVHIVQKAHLRLANAIIEHGLFEEANNLNYPTAWHNAAKIIETHPGFYVKPNGNLVFVPDTKAEYYRDAIQMKIGALGLHPWKYRQFLRPPTKPKRLTKDERKRLE